MDLLEDIVLLSMNGAFIVKVMKTECDRDLMKGEKNGIVDNTAVILFCRNCCCLDDGNGKGIFDAGEILGLSSSRKLLSC